MRNGLIAVALVIVSHLTSSQQVTAQPILTVMQESAPGVGDFNANVLGTVRAWRTALSPSQFYAFDGCSYQGDAIDPVEARVTTFFAQTSVGLTLYQQHGAPGGGGARAEFRMELTPRMSGETYRIYTPSAWSWWYCTNSGWRRDEWDTGSTPCDFGFSRWPLDGAFTLTLLFKQKYFECTGDFESPNTPPFQGLLDWMIQSSSGPRVELQLVENRRVRIVPCNSPSISEDLVRCVEGSAEFIVSPAGPAPFTYQWRRNEVEIPGETARSIFLFDVSSDDAGSYDCIVTNSCGEVITSARALTVCAADMTCDGVVNLSDLANLLINFGRSGSVTYGQGDLDNDDQVGLADLAILLAAFGNNCN